MGNVVVQAIPFKDFKEKLRIVKEEQEKGNYVEVEDKYIYCFKYERMEG